MSRFHSTSGWAKQKLNHSVLSRDPLCVCCLRMGRPTMATEADHIVPLHKGGTSALSNMQGLCTDCHKLKTAADLGQVTAMPVGVDGFPLDPEHHWNAA